MLHKYICLYSNQKINPASVYLELASNVYAVPYTLRNLSSTTIYLSFTIDTRVYQLLLDQYIAHSELEVYVIGEDNSPVKDNKHKVSIKIKIKNKISKNKLDIKK